MVLKLYKNRSEKNALNKSISNEMSFDGTLREDTSIKAPVIKIAANSEIVNYNYAYISAFSRYYFISDIKSIRNGLWELYLIVDVLMSFKTDILRCYGIIDHTQSNLISEYLQSDIWQSLVKDKTDIINFDGSALLDSGEYILITAGG